MNSLETNLIPIVKGFFHKQSGTVSYVVIDSTTTVSYTHLRAHETV